jgi:hypothetical protein
METRVSSPREPTTAGEVAVMSLVTRLRTMSAMDLLHWIAARRKTGVLRLSRRALEKRLLLEKGIVHSTWSNEPREYLREFLLSEGLVSEIQIVEAFAAQEAPSGPRRLYGLIMVDAGILEEDDLCRVLAKKAEESITEIFFWPDGKVEFEEGATSAEHFVHIEMKIEPLIREGSRRVEELKKIREVFPSRRTTFRTVQVPEGLPDAERQMLDLVAPGKSLDQLGLETRRSGYEAAVLLHRLYTRGAIEVDEPGLDTMLPSENPKQLEIHLGIADEALKHGNFVAALKGYQDVLLVQAGSERAVEGLAAVNEAQGREFVRAGVSDSTVLAVKSEISLTGQDLDPTEGFVLSRVNGESDVTSIVNICPIPEAQTLLILARFLKQGVIAPLSPGP